MAGYDRCAGTAAAPNSRLSGRPVAPSAAIGDEVGGLPDALIDVGLHVVDVGHRRRRVPPAGEPHADAAPHVAGGVVPAPLDGVEPPLVALEAVAPEAQGDVDIERRRRLGVAHTVVEGPRDGRGAHLHDAERLAVVADVGHRPVRLLGRLGPHDVFVDPPLAGTPLEDSSVVPVKLPVIRLRSGAGGLAGVPKPFVWLKDVICGRIRPPAAPGRRTRRRSVAPTPPGASRRSRCRPGVSVAAAAGARRVDPAASRRPTANRRRRPRGAPVSHRRCRRRGTRCRQRRRGRPVPGSSATARLGG